ncbi:MULTISPECIES: M13 family metallopeptidase [unclassified Nesterenkonia]|uniref:M13 family metallopeptidase n=1 Tax=unclassified Nesterenkonia TaxID=2629769 RepID=UPI001F4D1798|nr:MULTISPECIES: M13-type metalloendopeptidase [unclassified Nesterenkonia]MCH8561026.1 peptidase M13 [Nesterenkonia sp. DZ6]MCH8571102.1 peptidase M13 [Nesterenkonia sp. AY15]
MTDTASSSPNAPASFPYIDHDVRPQDDLQRHVNGEWLKTAEIPADMDAYGSFHELRDKAEADVREILEQAAAGEIKAEQLDAAAEAVPARIGAFYTSFMDAEAAQRRGLSPIEPMLEQLESVRSVEDLVRLSAAWQRQGVDGLLVAGSMRDAGDPTRMLWHVMQSGLGLPDESYYRDEKLAEILAAYQDHLVRVLELSGVDDAADAAAAVVELEGVIAAEHWDKVTLRDAQKRYNLVTDDEAETFMPLLREAFAGWGLQPRHTEQLVLAQPDVLPGMQAALTQQPLRTWKLWLRVQLLRWAAPLLHEELVNENFDFYSKRLSGAQQLKERWKRGVALTNAHLGEDVAQIYVARHYPPQARAAMDELISALIEAYRQSISELSWMGEETKGRALEKLDAFKPMVGFPERWIDYSRVDVDPTDVVANVRRAAAFEWERDITKLDEGPDPDEWHMHPQTVNAYYSPLENVICFPAAILQLPFFSAERDMAQNFGAIGAVIGHELGHGFDDQGSRYGADGSLSNWWTEADRSAFEERTTKLVEQYSALTPSQAPEHKVNGELTLGENIGDLGGLGIAHKAYRVWLQAQGAEAADVEGYSADQRFFFAWAQAWRNLTRPERAVTLISIDPHAPAEFRATQVVKNLDAFHSAFETQPGDGMYLSPRERVTIW